MEICTHKLTGKTFIFLQEAGIDKAVCVTPQGKIKTLNIDQFNEIEDENKEHLLARGLVTALQIKRWEQYKKDRSDNETENFRRAFNQLSQYSKIQFFKGLPLSQADKERIIKKIKKGLM